MRIALMLRTLDEKGGIGVYTANLLDGLLRVGETHEFVLLYRTSGNLGRYSDRPNVTERLVRANGKAAWDQVGVPMACRREEVDVIFHPKFTVPLAAPAPTVMVLHGADWFLPEAKRFYTRADRAYIRVFMPLYLRRAAAVLSVSQLTTDHFERLFDLPAGKIRTTYFGPAPHFRRIAEPGELERVRRKYALPERFILTLSKHAGGERKNVRGILRAFARVHGAVPHALVIGGQGCDRFRHDYGIPRDGWGGRVHFPGWIDQTDLPAVYSLADLYLYPSNQEAFPIPVTEAMACGTPIVTSRANGLAEIAGDAAVMVDPEDAAAISEAARAVLTDSALRERLVAAGRTRSTRFSWDACARRTLATLEEVGRPAAATARARVA